MRQVTPANLGRIAAAAVEAFSPDCLARALGVAKCLKIAAFDGSGV
jgi:hypothetical protein